MLTTLALLIGLTAAAAVSGEEVDVELVLAVDVSRSMDIEEAEVQRAGYVNALRHPDFLNAVRGGLNGRIAITYFEWAGTVRDSSHIPWQIISGPDDANAFAAMQAIRVLLAGHAALGDPQWGRLHLFEGLVPSLRTMRIARDPECRGCSARG